MTTTRSRTSRFAALAITAALAGAIGPIAASATSLNIATPAYAVGGDVCDLCSTNFDIVACEALGGWAYDSTRDPVPPAVLAASNPQPQAPANPAPANPAPAPANPAPAPAPANPAPAQPNTSNGGTTTNRGGTTPAQNQEPAAVPAAATAPAAPGALAHTVAGRSLTLTWAAPADGGSVLTGYKLLLNGGAPIALAADASEYEITLGAGTYEATLIASNAVGDSDATAVLTGIEIDGETASPTPKPSASADAVLASDANTAASPLVGVLTLVGLVVVGGALVGWWWLRRRRAASAS